MWSTLDISKMKVRKLKDDELLLISKNEISKHNISYGLFDSNNLIQSMLFDKPHDGNNYQYKLVSIHGESSVDGFIKIWNYFISHKKITSCICRTESELVKEIVAKCGFHRLSEDLYSYYPFSVVYRVDDLTSNLFYIGMCESEDRWNAGYLGSGIKWLRHIRSHSDHTYRRVILKSGFKSPNETRDFEYESIKTYCVGNKINKQTGCMNTQLRTQGDPYTPNICPECGSNGPVHKTTCSKYKSIPPCIECGGLMGRHREGCSKYIRRRGCKECGSIGSHLKTCSKYKDPEPCLECGCKYGHISSCSKYRQQKLCEECHGIDGKHRKGCSKYKDPDSCKECGGKRSHKIWCSKYTRDKIICPECGGKSGTHMNWCTKFKAPTSCSICGALKGHLSSCPKFKKSKVCSECGGKRGHHLTNCSKGSGRCLECGYPIISNMHSPSCSRYISRKICDFCNSPVTNHKKWCVHRTQRETCVECGSEGGNHKKTCSKYKQADRSNVRVCEECGRPVDKHKSGCPNRKICQECGSSGRHKDSCSKSKKSREDRLSYVK